MSSASPNNNISSSPFRVNYSEYVADITGSPKTARQSGPTGIGHHINPLHNPYPSRQNQPIQPTGGMPQYGGGSEKCARCSKTVYIAEKKVGAGRSFHSSCFSCYTCKRKLDSTALSEHKGEIYCKPCYTKQFGAHGLISGVTMSTEHPVTREDRNSRRSSYGSDLDAPGITNQQKLQRAYSNENNFRDEYVPKHNDESPKKSPQRQNIISEQYSPSNKKNDGINSIVDTKYQSTSSPTKAIESNTNTNRHRSTYVEEDDRNKYVYEGEKLSYGSGASAIVEIPVVSHTKRSDSTGNRYEIPIESTRDNQRSQIPSVTSIDPYRRQSSREPQINFTDDYSRLTINEDNNNRKYSNDNTVNTIASENPLTTRNSYHSSSSSYETKYRNTTSNPNNPDREQYHSREASPATTPNRNRSPSPPSGYIASSTTRPIPTTYGVGLSRDPTSPSSNYVPQHEYYNIHTSSNYDFNNQRSPSPKSNDRTSFGLNDFVSKTNPIGNISSSNGTQNSTLSALVGNMRPRNQPNDDDDDYLD